MKDKWFAVMIARLNPTQCGHEVTCNKMIKEYKEDCMLILWSITRPPSLHDIFSYQERANFVKKIWPNLNIQWIPDFATNEEFFFALDQIIKWWYRGNMKNVTYYGWSAEDMSYLIDDNRKCEIINRFDWVSSLKISGSEVRDILNRHSWDEDISETMKALDGIVNPLIREDVIRLYNKKIIELKKR